VRILAADDSAQDDSDKPFSVLTKVSMANESAPPPAGDKPIVLNTPLPIFITRVEPTILKCSEAGTATSPPPNW